MSIIASTFGVAVPDGFVADPSVRSTSQLSDHSSDSIDTQLLGESSTIGEFLQFHGLEKRDLPSNTSTVYVENHLFEWIFSYGGIDYNISISKCIHPSEVIGIYQFHNGSTKHDATVSDIISDFGYGKPYGSPQRFDAIAYSTSQAAYNEGSTFLQDSVLCGGGNSASYQELRRRLLFQSDGRISALIVDTVWGVGCGIVGAYVSNGRNTTGRQIIGGGVGVGAIIFGVGLNGIFRGEDGYRGLENVVFRLKTAFMATILAVRLRAMIWWYQNRGALGRCFTADEVEASVNQLGTTSNSQVGLVSMDAAARAHQACDAV